MMQRLFTLVLLVCIFFCALYLTRLDSDLKVSTFSDSGYSSNYYGITNTISPKRYNVYIKNIGDYRLGTPRFYNNPNAPYSNPYPHHPPAFIDGYRQPIDGIVYDNYTSPTLEKSNMMFPLLDETFQEYLQGYPKMDMTEDYYSDLLNTDA